MRVLYFLCISGLFAAQQSYALRLQRVILATDANPEYIQFWPLAAKFWREVVGVRPTLALVADTSVTVDESLGDVIRFMPLDGIPTSLQAQVIRLLLPVYFENDVCIISDIDMIPLQKQFFVDAIKSVSDDCFVVYNDRASLRWKRYPMCYNAAKGKVFKEIFGITTRDQIPAFIRAWAGRGYGWNTDELVLYDALQRWPGHAKRCKKLGNGVERRVDRSNWQYNPLLLRARYYRDAHLPRPYQQYKEQIDELAHEYGIIDI
ncbi:MAG TPA: hypothetical protein VLG71_00835 [Candidatus Limnocylindria bacterium]|nr:hypothetical protein [Candidatus Limnocylindria bacterium]